MLILALILFGTDYLRAQSFLGRGVSLACPARAVRVPPDEFERLVLERAAVVPSMMEPLNFYGTVVAKVCLDKNGTVVGIQTVSGSSMALGAVVDSLRIWKFSPYIRNGKPLPVRGLLSVPFDFRVKGAETSKTE
jgi:hypothetical protein